MIKKLLAFLPLFLIILFPKTAEAYTPQTFMSFSNPVRGYEGWNHSIQTPLDLPKYQYQESTKSGVPTTWLLRYDAVESATISAYFKNLSIVDTNESLGAFFEITPRMASDADVPYPDGISIFNANRVFLSGYSQADRIALIDTYMTSFFNRFGYYPKSVAAWHLDSYSLQYLQSKYSVLAAMNCDDQYTTDNYRIWGGYLGSPYFPDKNNSLLPASSLQNRVNLAMVRWAQRDLFRFYGYRSESSFSVQVNDYLSMGQNTKYFESLLSLYSQHSFNEVTFVNIGLENDYSLADYRTEIKNVYRSVKANQGKFGLNFISLADFGDWMKSHFPESSPAYFYRTTDPAGKEKGEVYWYQSPFYRIGLKSVNGQTKIIDLRVYNREIYEEYFATPNQDLNLHTEIPAVIDSVKFPGTELSIGIDLTQFQTTYDKQWDLWQLTLSKGDQKIIFYPKSISFTNITAPEITSKEIKVSTKGQTTTWEYTPSTPLKDNHQYSWLLWVVAVIVLISIIKKLSKNGKPKVPLYLVAGLIFVTITGLTVFRSGQIFPFGLGFFGPNGHDAIFHLSLIEKFSQSSFNFSHPQYAGSQLSNYHFVFDYFSGLMAKLFKVPPTSLYFLYLPVLFGVILVFLLNKLLTQWGYSPREKKLAYFFAFLGGSLGFIPKLISGQSIFTGESVFWANQSASLFLNPPFTLSLIFLLLFLVNLPPEKKISPIRFLKLALLGGLLAQTKVYSFVLLAIALFLNRQIILTLAVGLVGGLFSLPFSSLSGSPFIFEPLWFPRSLFASYDRLYWPRFVSAWQTYESAGNLPKLFLVNLVATVVFLVGNLGFRLFGLWGMNKDKPETNSEKVVHWIILIGIILPLLFVQKDNPWNTIQFMYYSLFFLGLFTGKAISQLFVSIKVNLLRFGFLLFVLVFGSITTIGTLQDYVGQQSPSRISFTEMAALEKLKNLPQGIVISPLFQKADQVATPKPLYAYVSTAYISAFSGQTEFLSDTINLDITGFNYQQRAKDLQRFYNTKDKVWAKSFLVDNKIKYIYETPLQKMHVSPGDLSLTKVFDSGEINIYQTN